MNNSRNSLAQGYMFHQRRWLYSQLIQLRSWPVSARAQPRWSAAQMVAACTRRQRRALYTPEVDLSSLPPLCPSSQASRQQPLSTLRIKPTFARSLSLPPSAWPMSETLVWTAPLGKDLLQLDCGGQYPQGCRHCGRSAGIRRCGRRQVRRPDAVLLLAAIGGFALRILDSGFLHRCR